jgi:hypothetical protein
VTSRGVAGTAFALLREASAALRLHLTVCGSSGSLNGVAIRRVCTSPHFALLKQQLSLRDKMLQLRIQLPM